MNRVDSMTAMGKARALESFDIPSMEGKVSGD